MSDQPFNPEDIEPSTVFESEQVVPNHEASKDNGFTLFGTKKKDPLGDPAEKPRKPTPPMPRRGLKKPLTDIYTTLGTLMFPFDNVCGNAVIESAEQCAESLETLARENEAVRRVLIMLCETSAWGMVITAHLPILMAVTAHHMPQFKGIPEEEETSQNETEREAA